MAHHVRRELFKRHADYVVVRPIRLTSTTVLEPGDEVSSKNTRMFQLRSWYNRRRIGVKGSPWADAMLADLENAHARPEVTGCKEDTPPSQMTTNGVTTVQRDGESVEEFLKRHREESEQADDDVVDVEVVPLKGGWRRILIDGEEVAKVKGDAAVDEWMEDNGYEV